MRTIRRALPRKNAGPVSQDPAVSSGGGAWLELNRIPLADLQFAPVEALRLSARAAHARSEILLARRNVERARLACSLYLVAQFDAAFALR